MSYPWPGFSSFLFLASEQALPSTDSGWVPSPKVERNTPLGSSRDVIAFLANGSLDRSFECVLTPARFAELQLLMNNEGTFVDWMRPTPDARDAYLLNVEQTEELWVLRRDSTDGRRRLKTRISLVSR